MIYNEIHISTSEITSKLELFAHFLARCMLTWLDLLSVVLVGTSSHAATITTVMLIVYMWSSCSKVNV